MGKAPGRAGKTTPYAGIRAVLAMLLEEVHAVLGEQFVGLYVCAPQHGFSVGGALMCALGTQ
jgi:hypothetical protein